MEQVFLGPILWAEGQSYDKAFSFDQSFTLRPSVVEWRKEKERQERWDRDPGWNLRHTGYTKKLGLILWSSKL